jgi:hypothetical protein
MNIKKCLSTGLAVYFLVFSIFTPEVYAQSGKAPQPAIVEVKPSDTAKLKELLEKQKIDARLADGTLLKGRVKEVIDGAVVIKIEQSEGPGAMAKGEHSIATDKITEIKIVRYKGSKRVVLATVLGIAGLAASWAITATEFAGESQNATYGGIAVATTAAGIAGGYAWGRALDKKEVTIVIK